MRRTGLRPNRRSLALLALLSLLAASLVLLHHAPAIAQQQLNQLDCRGQIYGLQAIISGQRLFSPYNALGDGEVAFSGQFGPATSRARSSTAATPPAPSTASFSRPRAR